MLISLICFQNQISSVGNFVRNGVRIKFKWRR